MKKKLKKGMLQTPDLAQKTHDGDKTVTRRVIVPQPPKTHPGTCNCENCQRLRADQIQAGVGPIWRWYPKRPAKTGPRSKTWVAKPRYRPGDIVSIKEYHWRWGHKEKNTKGNWSFVPNVFVKERDTLFFRKPDPSLLARAPNKLGYHGISGLFLPYDIARTHVEILDARPEDLHVCNAADACLEGYPGFTACGMGALEWLIKKWDSINGKKHPWAGNWWVWRYLYRRVELKA